LQLNFLKDNILSYKLKKIYRTLNLKNNNNTTRIFKYLEVPLNNEFLITIKFLTISVGGYPQFWVAFGHLGSHTQLTFLVPVTALVEIKIRQLATGQYM